MAAKGISASNQSLEAEGHLPGVETVHTSVEPARPCEDRQHNGKTHLNKQGGFKILGSTQGGRGVVSMGRMSYVVLEG